MDRTRRTWDSPAARVGSNALQTIANFTYTTSANEPTAPTLPAGATSVSNFSNQLFNAVSTDPAAVPSVSTDTNTLTITSAAGTRQPRR